MLGLFVFSKWTKLRFEVGPSRPEPGKGWW